MKLTIPTTEIQTGGSLETFYYDLLIGRSDLIRMQDNGTTTMEGNLLLSIGQVAQILAAGGEVYELLLAVQADIALLGDNLPTPLPNENTLSEAGSLETRKFKNWFDTSAEVWKKDDNTRIYFLTNPIGTSVSKYLTGSQIALIYNSFKSTSPLVINRNCMVRTIAQFQMDIASGWTQIVF